MQITKQLSYAGVFLLALVAPFLTHAERISLKAVSTQSKNATIEVKISGLTRTTLRTKSLRVEYSRKLSTNKMQKKSLRLSLTSIPTPRSLKSITTQVQLKNLLAAQTYFVKGALLKKGRSSAIWSKTIKIKTRAHDIAPTPTPNPPSGAQPTPTPTPLRFPLEVFWPEGTTTRASLETPQDAAYMTFRTYNLSYEGIGSVRIKAEDSAWTDWLSLTNQNITLLTRGNNQKKVFGIGGMYQTRLFTIPKLGVYPGKKVEVEFRYDKANLITTSFKILDINFIDLTGKKLLNHSLTKPNYESQPKDEATIAKGKNLWLNKSLLTVRNGESMRAKCTSCHFDEGSDLKFFGFSPETIENRAFFHGLSIDESKQIAAYISSLPVVAEANPWDPPFQPGPGISQRTGNGWLAGAGIDAVLENPDDIIKYVVGDSPQKEDFEYTKEFEQRDVPIPFELPDWNSWLPNIHPDDVLQGTPFATHVQGAVTNLRNKLANNSSSYFTDGTAETARTVFELYSQKILLTQEAIALGKGSTSTPHTRRAVYEITKLPMVKVLSAIAKYPHILEKKIWPSKKFAHNLFIFTAPFELIGTQQMEFRGFDHYKYTDLLNIQWWHTASLGLTETNYDLNTFSFRWSYVAMMFGPLHTLFDADAVVVLYFKKMLERANYYKLLHMGREPLEKIFSHLTSEMLNRNQGLADAMLDAIVATHNELGGKSALYSKSSEYASQLPNPILFPAVTSSQLTTISPTDQWIIDGYERLVFGIGSRNSTPITSVSTPSRNGILSMVQDIWPQEDWNALVSK